MTLHAAPQRATSRARVALGCIVLFALTIANNALGQSPEWIWQGRNATKAAAGETRYFRKVFQVPFQAQGATLTAAGDDEITVYLNGVEVAHGTLWKTPVTADVTARLIAGTNVLAVRGRNEAAGPAAILVKLEVRSPNMFGLFVVSDSTWICSAAEAPGWKEAAATPSNGWVPAVSYGKVGVQPWGDILQPPQATPPESLTVLPGFKAELLRSAQRDEGSWIAMCVDGKGRLIISPEKTEVPLLRVTLTPSGAFQKIEKLTSPLRGAMGLCWAYDSLYVNGRGPKGVGLYRLIDRDHNDQFDPGEEILLKNFDGDNEHGYHAVIPGPDGAIYVINGNHTKVPAGVAADSPHRNYAEDLLLPRQWDANGHAKGILAPGGYVLRTDRDGKEWRLICGGFRNAYDFDFSPQGELFTFDSDMEWDVGAPWYRPTRILHCVSGGEYGWRSGTGKWPEYYPDSLPSVVDIGLSSPTGVRFGTSSHFPEKYQRALFAADWAYGKIFAVHLQLCGATFKGTFETFVSGKPLAVTALTFGQDGAMYFIIGGWKIQSGLYRISYQPTPGEKAVPDLAHQNTPSVRLPAAVNASTAARRQLEQFHGKIDPRAVAAAWPYLGSQDRWLRFAARIAVESQPAGLWRSRALAETNVDAALTALLALARCGETNDKSAILARCLDIFTRLTPNSSSPASNDHVAAQQLDTLRVLQVAFTRLGRPNAADAAKAVAILMPCYANPTLSSPGSAFTRELCQLVIYLDPPSALENTLRLLSTASRQEDQMHYAFALRNVNHGWTAAQRAAYFGWFQKALAEYKGGASFAPYLVNIRRDALAQLPESERAAITPLLADRTPPALQPHPRQLVKEWLFTEVEPVLAKATKGRSFKRGRQAFIDAQCVLCHRINGEGGAVGPDLTGVSGRFGYRDLLENIIFPSKIISDRYQSYTITKRDGDEVSGCVTDETDDKLVVIVNPLSNQRETVAKKDIASREVSKTSAMPEGLLNVLEQDEILDLLAFLESDGKSSATVFAQRK